MQTEDYRPPVDLAAGPVTLVLPGLACVWAAVWSAY
jgi:hypothetical protein